MQITLRGLATMMHGMFFGAFFLMATFGFVVELGRAAQSDRPSELTPRGLLMERVYILALVLSGWAAVLTGAYLIYPWYRAVPPSSAASLALYPRYLLLSSPTTAGWHNLGMEWKEHVAWIAVIAMTMVGWVYTKHPRALRAHPQLRTAVLIFALAALGSAGVAGFFGAMLNKYAPVNGTTVLHLMGKTE